MKKQAFPLFVFLVLTIAIVALFYFGGQKKLLSLPKPTPSPSASASAQVASFEWPLPPDSREVTAVYAHYYFSGKIAEIQKTNKGGEIKLETTNDKIPKIVTDEQTRFSLISLPYSTSTMRPIKFDKLAVGTVVDVSIEYDLRGKNWIVRDVYVPDDRN